MEQEINQLKSQRTATKAKLSSLVNTLKQNSRQECSDSIREVYTDIHTCYDKFLELHFLYAEYVNSDDSYTKYATVNGMDLDTYLQEVTSQYDWAVDFYKEHRLKIKRREAIQLMEEVKLLLKSQGLKDSFFCENLDKFYTECKALADELASIDRRESVLGDLDGLVLQLYNAKLKTSVTRPRLEGRSGGYIDSVEMRATGQANTEGEGFSNEVLHSMPGSSQYVSSDPARFSGEVGTSRNEKQSFTVSDLRSSLDGISAPVSASFKSDKSSVVYAYVNKPVDKTNPLSSGTNKDYLNSQSVNASNRPRCVQPPVFDGNRKKWPEFRSVWMRYAANEFVDDIDRAHALKELLRGEALEYVGAIYATQANAYDRILDRLDTIYSDVSMCVQSVLEDLQQLKSFKDSDMKALVKFVNLVETAYSQLGEVGHINAICMTHIDSLADLLPMSIKRQWMRQFSVMSQAEKLHPFPHFMVFLENERSIALRLVERDKRSQFKAESQSSSSSKRMLFLKAKRVTQNLF